jgi:hypothetical protein
MATVKTVATHATTGAMTTTEVTTSAAVSSPGAMAYVVHPVTGMRHIPAVWLDGFRPSGFRLATVRKIVAWHGERSLTPPDERAGYCPCCLRRVQPAQATRRVYREACASGPIDVWLSHCPTCGAALHAEVIEPGEVLEPHRAA